MSIGKLAALFIAAVAFPLNTVSATLSFLVDPSTIDIAPPDGFITGTEFSPVGSDGLSFGGGGGSTLAFDFTPDADIQLEFYALGGGIGLGNPIFDILAGTTYCRGPILVRSTAFSSVGHSRCPAEPPIALS